VITRRSGLLILLLCLLAFLALPVITIVSAYFLASYQFDGLTNNLPSRRGELESRLFWYSSRQIAITDSMWGKRYKLQQGQYCQQYNILGMMPIDVIYGGDDRVIHVMSSFE
jgi:hypothetical protein